MIARALERFAMASWREMVKKEGNTDKVYSPYSAFVALLMSAILAHGETREELLKALQFESDEEPETLAYQLADLILHSEYSNKFYDKDFGRILEAMHCEGLTDAQKCYLYSVFTRKYGSLENLNSLCTESNWKFRDEFCWKCREIESSPCSIAGANNLWPNKNLPIDMEQFSLLTRILHASISPVVFPEPGVSQINKFIEDITSGLIKNLLPVRAATADTACILTNAIYFKAKWAHKFKSSSCATGWTNVKGRNVRSVSFMNQQSHLPYLETDKGQFVSVDYRSCDYSMIIALPKETGEEAMNAFADSISPELLSQVSSAPARYEICLTVPKFKSRWGTKSLSEMLRDLGVSKIFSEEAEFIECGDYPCYISDVLQQSFIEVDEEGTEAAAATAVGMAIVGCALNLERPILFTCDHSFMYFLRNKHTGSILFMGLCDDPKYESSHSVTRVSKDQSKFSTLCVSPADKLSDDSIESYFGTKGSIASFSRSNDGRECFIMMKSSIVDQIVSEEPGLDWGVVVTDNRSYECMSPCEVTVSPIRHLDNELLCSIFSEYSGIEKVTIDHSDNVAVIVMERTGAQRAITALNGKKLHGKVMKLQGPSSNPTPVPIPRPAGKIIRLMSVNGATISELRSLAKHVGITVKHIVYSILGQPQVYIDAVGNREQFIDHIKETWPSIQVTMVRKMYEYSDRFHLYVGNRRDGVTDDVIVFQPTATFKALMSRFSQQARSPVYITDPANPMTIIETAAKQLKPADSHLSGRRVLIDTVE